MATGSPLTTPLTLNVTSTPIPTITPPNFIAIMTIMLVVGVMFGTTIVVIILVALWPKKKKQPQGRRRRRSSIGGPDDTELQDIDSVYAELDNKSVSTTMTRMTSEYSLDSVSTTDMGGYTNEMALSPDEAEAEANRISANEVALSPNEDAAEANRISANGVSLSTKGAGAEAKRISANGVSLSPNGAAVEANGISEKERTSTATSKKVRFSDHQVEIPGVPNGIPRNKIYIDIQ